LWFRGYQGGPVVSRDDVLDLLNQAARAETQIERWTESTRIKLAGIDKVIEELEGIPA
jgi:hypothetical protein